jgi:phage-related tail fiber protein
LAGSYANPTWITSLAWSKLTGVPATFAPSAHTHAATDIVSGVIATARLASGTASATTYLRGDQTWATLPTGGITALTGDVTASGSGSVAATLANSGVTIGTYRSVTVNVKGIITGGSNPTTVSGYGITDFYSQVISGFVTGANSTVLNTDSLEVALEKLQGQINGRFTTPTGLTANYLPKWNGTAFVNSRLIDNGTNVGINIAVPASTFHISSASTILSITSTDTTSGLRINVLGQTTGIIFRVQSAGTTLLQQNTNGRLLVGYTTEANAYKVQVDSGAVGGLGLYVRGNINATGNIIADGYFSGTSSDKSYKSNFKKVTVINVIDNIKVLSYNHELYNNSRLIGSIAQDIQKYFPELITIDGKGKLRVDNYGYAALSLQLGKELKNEIDVLKEKINKLELQIEKLSK